MYALHYKSDYYLYPEIFKLEGSTYSIYIKMHYHDFIIAFDKDKNGYHLIMRDHVHYLEGYRTISDLFILHEEVEAKLGRKSFTYSESESILLSDIPSATTRGKSEII